MKRPWPRRSSTLSPKIHRYHMLPMTCDQLPCRNIEVMSVGRAEVRGHDAVDLQETGEHLARQRQLVEPRQRVQDDDRDGDVGRGPGRDDVPQRNHEPIRSDEDCRCRCPASFDRQITAILQTCSSEASALDAVSVADVFDLMAAVDVVERRAARRLRTRSTMRRRSPSPIALRCSPMVMTAW